MNKYFKLALIVLLQILVIIFWGNIKEGYFIDELYSMEGAHQISRLSLNDKGYKWQTEDDFFERWHESDEYIEHITVFKEDSILNLPMQKWIKKLLRNPHYALLNLYSSINPGHYSKWNGIIMNIFIFVLEQLLLYSLVFGITKNDKDALIAIGLYGFSAGAISTAIFIRTYMLCTVMVDLQMILAYKLMEEKKTKRVFLYVILLLMVSFLGYKTHQYVLMVAASLFIVVVVYLILQKEWKKLGIYAGMFGLAGIGYISIVGLDSMLSGEQGQAAVYNLFNKPIVDFIKDICSNSFTLLNHLFGSKYWIVLAVAVCTIIYLFKLKNKDENLDLISFFQKNIMPIIMLMTVIVYIIVIGRLCPWVNWRYISSVYPIMIASFYLLAKDLLPQMFERKKAIRYGIAFWCVCIVLSYNTKTISELHLGAKEEARILREDYSDIDNVFVYDGDEGRLYLNSYIYPSDTRVFITEKSDISQEMVYANEEAPDKLLIWVSAIDEKYFDTVDNFVASSVYNSAEVLLDRSRHNECYYVYLLKK